MPENLAPDRLRHATALLERERATAMVRERGLGIEACITGHVHAGAFRLVEDRPAAAWAGTGLGAILCADNTLLSTTTVPEGIENAAGIPGMSRELLGEMLSESASVGIAR